MVNQSGGEEDVVIHTMRDDVAGTVPPATPSTKPIPTPSASQPIPITRFQAPISPPVPPRSPLSPKTVPKPAPAASQQFPLPPRPSTPPVAGAKDSATPQPPPAFIPRRRRRRPILWATIFLLLLGGAAASIYAYFFWFVPQTTQPTATPSAPAALEDIIPASADVVVRYRISSPDVRGQLLELWQGSTKPLLQGNPASLLASGNLTEFAYIMVADNSRPFLLIPKDTLPPDVASTLNQAQIEEFSGWQVLHGLSAASFREAVQAGRQTLAPPTSPSSGHGGLEISLSQAALNQMRSHIASPSFSAGLLTSVTVTANPSPSGKSLRLSGTSNLPASPTPAVAPSQSDQSLLEQVPSDATFVRLGASLQQDVSTWQTIANILDSRVLAIPAVTTLFQQFETPYAYYHRAGPDGVNDVGLIAEIPASLTPPLTIGDPTLEQALTALLPLITTSPPAATLRFAEGIYQGTPLRFVNLAGSTEALDYTVAADHILISTSKEGMFALLDTTSQLLSDTPTPRNFATAAPWAELLTEWQIVPEAEHLLFGRIQYVPLLDLLPVTVFDVPFGLAATPGANGQILDGVVLLPSPTTPPDSPISPQPSP